MTKPINLPIFHGKQLLVNPRQAPNILVEIVYGLINRDCRGRGICKINHTTETGRSATNSICGSSYAYLQVKGARAVRLFFLRNTISACQFEFRFQSGYFVLEESYVFTEEWNTFLNMDQAVIEVGTYPILFSDTYLQVDFSLTKKPKSTRV